MALVLAQLASEYPHNSSIHRNLAEEEYHIKQYTSGKMELPAGFPKYLTSNLTWSGPQLSDNLQYIYHVTENDKVEIDAALKLFKSVNHPIRTNL